MVRASCPLDDVQLDIKGYDPEVYAYMELIDPKLHDPKDDRTRRSHIMIATALGLGVADIEKINHVKIRLA